MGAELKWTTRPVSPTAAVLVLHGGQDASQRTTRWSSLAVVRMLPIARGIARAGQASLAVARLRYAVRGWNGTQASPVADARSALAEIANAYPGLPIALVGHSMGGRVALALADDPRVTDVVGLAPWVVPSDKVQAHDGQRTLLIHGMADRTTSAAASRLAVESLQGRGLHASFVGLRNTDHAMLRRAKTWDRLVEGYLGAAFEPAFTSAPGLSACDLQSTPAHLGARASRGSLVTVI